MARKRQVETDSRSDRELRGLALERNARHQRLRIVVSAVLFTLGLLTIALPLPGLEWWVGLVWVFLGFLNLWELSRLRREAAAWRSVPE